VTTWLVRRLAASLAIIFAVVTLIFFLIHLAPGDPFLPYSDTSLDPAVVARLRTDWGLDKPLRVQYWRYLVQLAHGNLGESFAFHRPVADVLRDTVPNTLVLTGTALALDLLLGLLLGAYQATQAHRLPDLGIGFVTLFLYSVPTFWLGLVVVLVFGQWLQLFPVGGVVTPALHDSLPFIWRVWDRIWHLTLPALTLGCVGAAGTARFQRAAMLETLRQDFVRTARAKGLPERRVVLAHALRNALLPLITLLGLSLPFLLTGAVLVETVFAWPGMGRLAAASVFRRDYPVVMAVAIGASTIVVLGNLIADVLYSLADPRIRVQEQ
jgi:peptide/nickel transport system permease protein